MTSATRLEAAGTALNEAAAKRGRERIEQPGHFAHERFLTPIIADGYLPLKFLQDADLETVVQRPRD